MRYACLIFTYLITWQVQAQALQDINYNYLYNPNEKFSFQMKPVRTEEGWVVLFNLYLKDKNGQAEGYSIQLEKRKDLNDKQGVPLQNDSLTRITISKSANSIVGEVTFGKDIAPKVLVVKVVDDLAKKAWLFYEFLPPEFPVNSYLISSEGQARVESYILSGSSYSIRDLQSNQQPWVASYYADDFPAGAPAFSEGQARVPSVIRVDSTIVISSGYPSTYTNPGLYLIQKDTSASAGFCFRVYDDYPKFSKLENLVDPMIYVCTKQETERLKAAKGDKKSFDRVILGITGNTERAKSFMRNYFQRVELANQYFGSYKEGWKTDRGMMYIIFGLPDEVYKFTDREVWAYKNDLYKVTFDFVRSPTLFDPDNYVLIRNKKYQETWYQVIDLWRNARF